MYNPDLYTTANDPQRRDAIDFCDEFADEIGEMSGRCLDIGTGPGDIMADFILPKIHPKATIVCSDISEAMLNFGRDKYRDNSRMSFLKLNIESPDLSRDLVEQFDHIISYNCIHWCQDMRQVFENILNLLRPGGTALLTFVASFPGYNAYKLLAAMPRYDAYMEDADRYMPVFQHAKRPREALKSLLKDIGFEIYHCSIREKSYIFQTPKALEKFMMALNPFVERMPPYLREMYTKDVVREVSKLHIIINKNNNNESEPGELCIYYTFRVYLTKPFSK